MRRAVATFLGVADLDDVRRKKFLDNWLTRAEKIHDDDLLLGLKKCRSATTTTSRYQQSQQPSRDATDAR